MTEFAQELSGALGRTIQYVDVPPQIWEATLQEAQLPADLTAHLLTIAQLYRDHRYERMTDAFQQVVGRAPISPAEFARRIDRYSSAVRREPRRLRTPEGRA
jgi:hypothetical protein